MAYQPIVVDPRTGRYLGNYNNNQLDPNSIANPYGKYGDPNRNTVNNPHGQYGGSYSRGYIYTPIAPMPNYNYNWGYYGY